ncbi:MAG TPA: hypothetical protein VNJ46_04565 [Gaiellaceae bacterium]|nr:hypothetical protein [Gaiellaceae bacterium]
MIAPAASRLRDERGLALPLALGVTLVLVALGAAIFTYVTANQGSAHRSKADTAAYGLAEAGLSTALSKLESASDPYSAAAVPSTWTTVTMPGGTIEYRGELAGSTWTLYGRGTVANPTGPGAASVVRAASLQAQVTTQTVGDLRPWKYLFIDQPSGCVTLGNLVSLTLAVYVRGDLCLENNAQVWSPAVHVLGSLYVNNSASVGTASNPIDEFLASGACHYSGTPVTCGPAARVYANRVATSPPAIAKPQINLANAYDTAQLGPRSNCNVGSFPGGANAFDNEAGPRSSSTTMNASLPEVDLTPSTGYDCERWEDTDGNGTLDTKVAELEWIPGSPGTLRIKGTIFFDGDVTWNNLNLIQYDGQATIYASSQIVIKNRADLCGVPGCDSSWDPNTDMLVLVAGSVRSETLSTDIGNQVVFQGAIYAVNDLEIQQNTTIWGPVIARNATISNSVTLNALPKELAGATDGMPVNQTTQPVVQTVAGSYAG